MFGRRRLTGDKRGQSHYCACGEVIVTVEDDRWLTVSTGVPLGMRIPGFDSTARRVPDGRET